MLRRSILFTALIACAALPVKPAQALGSVKTRTLAKLPQNFRKRTFAVSDDGGDCAYVERTVAGMKVVFRGQAGPIFAEVSGLVLSDKTHRLFYWATDAALGPNNFVLMADGERIATGMSHQSPPKFSADGKRWAVAGGVAGRKVGDVVQPASVVVLVDGKPLATHKDTTLPVFSPDGAHVAYIAQEMDESFGLVIDGQVRWKFDKPTGLASFPAVQGEVGPNLNQLFSIYYLSDGSLLFVAQDKDGWAVYRNGTRLASYLTYHATQGQVNFDFGDELRDKAAFLTNSFGTAANAPVAAWWERIAGAEQRWRVSRDGVPLAKTCALYWGDNPPFITDDGHHVAYQCWSTPPGTQAETKADMMFDETNLGSYQNIWGIGFSADGQHVAFAGAVDRSDSGWRVYLDGRYYAMPYAEIWRPRLTPDGKHVAWEAKRKQRGVLIIDGDSRASFDEVMWGPEFVLPDTISWVIRRRTRLIRVDAAY